MAVSIPDSAANTPPPPEWTQPANDPNLPAGHSVPSGGGPTPPTQVDTTTLDAFAKYMGDLVPFLNNLIPDLNLVNVQPGAFYHADQIRTVINGLNGDAGLKSRFQSVISDLVQGLTDIQTAVTEMSTKYKSTEELNNMSSDDLTKEFQSVQADFSALMNDAGNPGAKSGSGG
jgi:hypothetical protein